MVHRLATTGLALGTVWALAAAPAGAVPRPAGEPARMADAQELSATLDESERALRRVSRGTVTAEVRARAQALGVEAPVERLVDLLFERGWLDLAAQRCALAASPGPDCGRVEAALRLVEEEFRSLAGFSAEEFKGGRRTAGAGGLALRRGGGQSLSNDPYHCRCSASVYSFDRWLNRYWALECNNHGGHGVCSTNLDSAHSAGSGAMTGDISVFFGVSFRGQSCPDDHKTCFKGPKPSKPGGGEWGNVCNCDTLHSQFSNPFGSWYGGDLTDAVMVYQGSYHDMVGDGSCDGAWIQVNEYVKENDPICCDDPMGTLVAARQVSEGSSSADVPASAQNCNGGSQSGVPPYCGTFGATIRIVTSCTTFEDDPFGSCWGRCGEAPPEMSCSCEFGCQQNGNCCWDYCDACTHPDMPAPECSAF